MANGHTHWRSNSLKDRVVKLHRLSQVDLEKKSAACKQCGPVTLWIDPKGKRDPRCPVAHDLYLAGRRAYGERERRKKARKFCRVMRVDRDTLTGVCAKCGPVVVRPRTFGKYFTCINSWNRTRSLACTAYSHGLSVGEARAFVIRVGVCQNRGCGKVLQGSGNRSDQGHVDHDHATAVIRGVLCSACNHTIGMAKDSVEVLAGLIEYLNSPPGYTGMEINPLNTGDRP